MKTALLNPKRRSKVGPGGWKCPCCGPAPRYRKAVARAFKRAMYQALDRELKKELSS